MTTQYFPVKFVEGTDDTLRILGVPYGGPFTGPDGKGSDLDGERFTKKTDLCLKWFPNDRPLLFDHGHDASVEVDPVGRFESKSITQADDGWWLDAQLDKSNRYFSAITDLVNKGKLYASSGAMGHLVKVDNKGNIERWPLVEVSLTPTPSNLLAQVGFGTVVKHYKSAGIELDVLEEADKVLSGVKAFLDYGCTCDYCLEGVKAKLDAEDRDKLSASDFAYVDSDGGKHLPIHDEAHVRNAISRFGQTHFESDDKKRSAAKKIVARAHKFDIDVADDSAVAKAAKTFMDLIALAEASDDEDMKASAKTLMESVDTSGGFLVPEQVADKTVEKKPTGKKPPASSSTDDDGDDEDEDDAKKKAADMKDLVLYMYEHPEEAAEFMAAHSGKTVSEELEVVDYSDVLPLIKGDRLMLLAPTEQKANMAKDNEVVLASSSYYGDAPEGSVEDWLSDLCSLLNKGMFSPFGYAGYTQLLATFGVNGPGYAIVCVHSYDDDDDDHYYRVAFDADGNNEPVLGEITPYAAVYLPASQVPTAVVGADDDDDDAMGKSVVPLLVHGAFTNRVAKAYLSRTKDVNDRRIKEGRVLSSANRERISSFLDQWKAVGEDLQTLYDSTAPPAKANLDRLRQEMEVMEIELATNEFLTGVN